MALGAFLAGLLLAETEFSLQVESDIAPYRGLLLGLFFMTVGYYIIIRILVLILDTWSLKYTLWCDYLFLTDTGLEFLLIAYVDMIVPNDICRQEMLFCILFL